MAKRKRSSRSLGSVGTFLSRTENLPGLISDGRCSSALTMLIHAHEDYFELPISVRFNAAELNGALTKLNHLTDAFRRSCLRTDALGLSGSSAKRRRK